MAVQLPGKVYLFEFKVVARNGDGSALRQIKARRYAEEYEQARSVRLRGVKPSHAEHRAVRRGIRLTKSKESGG